MKKHLILGLLLAFTFARESLAATYNDIEGMMATAIAKGGMEGDLTGPIAEAFTRQFRSTGRLHVKITELEKLAKPGCSRLSVAYTKYDVPTPKGQTEYFLTTDLSYCKDGAPPLGETITLPEPKFK